MCHSRCDSMLIWVRWSFLYLSHRHHVTSHLKQHADSSNSHYVCVCVCVCVALHVGSFGQNTTSAKQVKSYLVEPKSPVRPPHNVVFASRNRARQNGSTELSFHTVTVCCWLLDHIKTSQVPAHSCSVYFMHRMAYTAVLTQTYSRTCPPCSTRALCYIIIDP